LAETGTTASVSVFFPAYNDAPSLPALIGKTFATLEKCARDYEVIVINDGSFDNTGAVLEELGAKLRTALAGDHASGESRIRRRAAVGLRGGVEGSGVLHDGDGQYDPGELPKLLAVMRPDVGW
jgi:glycosyltransferase involved in cell wall biosynthesis